MMRIRHIGLLFALLCVMSCGRARVIPERTFSKIYARMFLADQMVRNDNELLLVADTTLFYAPILEEFGYTRDDYVKSVCHYMEDPEHFAKIFESAKDILNKHIEELTAEERRMHKLDSLRSVYEAADFIHAPLYRDLESDSIRFDTVSVELDSIGMYEWTRIYPDTLFYGPCYVLKEVSDTSSRSDSSVVVLENVATKLKKLEDKSLPEAVKFLPIDNNRIK